MDIETKPCGCTVAEHEDGRKVYAPCVPCGLFQAAQALEQASSWWRRRKALKMAAAALAAVASTAQRHTQALIDAKRKK